MSGPLGNIKGEAPRYPARPLPWPRVPESADAPEGTVLASVTGPQLVAAGFAVGNAIPEGFYAFALRDEAGTIVATWDEGRWWTQYEGARFLEQLKREVLP